MHFVAAHLEACNSCAGYCRSLEQVQDLLAGLGPAPEPEDMLLRIAWPLAKSGHAPPEPVHGLNLAWRNTVGPFLLNAAAGFASAVLLLGSIIVLLSVFAQPESAQATPDEPLGKCHCSALPLSLQRRGRDQVGAVSGPVTVEAFINGNGQVYDYHIVKAPPTPRRAPRWKTCSCGAASSPHGASVSLFPVWRCFPSPASRYADK